MAFQENVSLRDYSTMRLGGNARYLTEVLSAKQLVEVISEAKQKNLEIIVIGEGSNVVWRDEGFIGLVIVNRILGFNKITEDEKTATYKIGAGEVWDEVVGRLVKLGLSGVECLSLIPGTAGATPVQNVGAYGQEIANTLINVEAYDTKNHEFVVIDKSDCAFGYRTSRFKTTDKGRFIITGITLKLSKSQISPPFYPALEAFLSSRDVKIINPTTIREAVIAIRSDKLPDWHKIANNGSFFGNPIINKAQYEKLKSSFPDIVSWPYDDGYKLSAGWLVENVGMRGYHDGETGMATSSKQAIILINEHAKTTTDLLKFRQKIVDAVKQKFGITLEQEPELLP